MKKILYSSLFLSILQSILFWHKDPGISIAIFLTATIILTIYNLKEKEMAIEKRLNDIDKRRQYVKTKAVRGLSLFPNPFHE